VFHRILVAIDGSEHARRALGEAIDLAKCANAKLTVMTVAIKPSTLLVGGPIVPPLDFAGLDEAIEAEHARLLDEAIEQVPHDISVERLLAHGSPARAILEQARQGGHDLVVVGSRGLGGVGAMVLGSVSHKVLHDSRVPVLVIHVEEEAQGG
jgi:nucleotide-binding universal stress UspA family protein